MSTVDELKKYKEMLDNSIITQEEFDKKKSELLAEGLSDSGETERKKIKKHTVKNKLRKPYFKKILIAVLVVAILASSIIGVVEIVKHNQEVARASARTSALEEAIEPIMGKYGLYSYSVGALFDDYFPIYAYEFESLTYEEALECLEELDNISIDDPCETGNELSFDSAHVFPRRDADYCYWRESSWEAYVRSVAGLPVKEPGLYCDQYGSDECIFPCAN